MVVGGAGEIMPGREKSWVVVAKFWFAVRGCGWLREVQAKLWLVVNGCGKISISLIFMEKVKSFTALLTLDVSRERTFYLQTKLDRVGLIGRLGLVSY